MTIQLSNIHIEREPDMESQARALNFYNHSSTAPSLQALADAETKRMDMPSKKPAAVKERIRKIDKVKAAAAEKVPGISVFAILGTLFVAALMVLVVLAQINFNEAAGETVRLNIHMNELMEKHKALELAFERAVDIKEVERFARDELGMSRPDTGQIIIINATPRDSAIILSKVEEREGQGFGDFLRSLTGYFR